MINAAGVYDEAAVIDHPDALWDDTIDTNLTGTFKMIRAVMPIMKAQSWGRIINLASNPQGALVQPEEIAELITFLVSDAGRAITMADILVNAATNW